MHIKSKSAQAKHQFTAARWSDDEYIHITGVVNAPQDVHIIDRQRSCVRWGIAVVISMHIIYRNDGVTYGKEVITHQAWFGVIRLSIRPGGVFQALLGKFCQAVAVIPVIYILTLL